MTENSERRITSDELYRIVLTCRTCDAEILVDLENDRQTPRLHPFLIEKHKRGRLEAGAKVMPNRELSVLRALFNRATTLGTYEGDNPVKAVKRLKESEGRVRFLEPAEEGAPGRAARAPPNARAGRDPCGPARARRGAVAHLAERRPPTQPADRPGRLREDGQDAQRADQQRAPERPGRAQGDRHRGRGAHAARRGAAPRTPHRLHERVRESEARGCDAPRAAPQVRLPAGHGRRGPPHDSGAGRLALAQDGRALRASVAESQGPRRSSGLPRISQRDSQHWPPRV